ncbi:MAG: glycosyltransferase [Oscillospiraceae bacterium]|nr:glycosyltransferase [Oscillospiraceae bacterium]
MKKILIACNVFAPDNEIAAVKTTKIAKYLLKSGYDVEVITEKNTYSAFDDHLLKGIEKIKPLYVHPTKSYFILKKLYDKIILPHKKKRFDDTTSKKRLRKNEETGLIETVPFETAYPFFGTIDYMMKIIKEKSLVKNAKKYIKEHKNDYDVCFSTYGRYFGHYIGEYIKKINPEVLWIAEFRDPVYNELFNAPPTRRHAEKFSENVYRKCDRITVISNGMKNLIPEKYRDKTTVLTNGFDRDDKIQDTSFEKKDKFRFIYTGRMYGGVRKTQRLFEVIKELSDENRIDISDFEFHYAGTGFKIFESQAKVFGLEKNCVDHGFVSHKKAMELQENSDILIVSTWEYKSQNVGIITGKVFEYMICEKPVIVLVNADFEDVELVSLARRCNIGFAFNEYNLEKDFKDLKEYIVMQYNLFKEGKELFYSPVAEEVEKYNYVNITKQLVNIIESSDK